MEEAKSDKDCETEEDYAKYIIKSLTQPACLVEEPNIPPKKEDFKQMCLDYHSTGIAGKFEITPTKPLNSKFDLSLAYSPGVAEPCLEI